MPNDAAPSLHDEVTVMPRDLLPRQLADTAGHWKTSQLLTDLARGAWLRL